MAGHPPAEFHLNLNNDQEVIAIIGLFVLCMAASISDIRRRIIPNSIVLCIYLLGMVRTLISKGVLHTLTALAYCLMILIAFYVIYLTGQIGAGDVKLYSAIPLYYPGDKILLIYLIIFCVAAVLALGRSFLLPSKRKRLKQIWIFLKFKYLNRIIFQTEMPLSDPDRIPMAVPMAIGIMISIILNNLGVIDLSR